MKEKTNLEIHFFVLPVTSTADSLSTLRPENIPLLLLLLNIYSDSTATISALLMLAGESGSSPSLATTLVMHLHGSFPFLSSPSNRWV